MSRQRATYTSITVLPYTRLLGSPNCPPEDMVGGPVFPEFDELTWQRHQREGEPSDSLPHPPPEPVQRLPGHWLWCGPVVLDFSHQFAEFMHRLPLNPRDQADGLLFAASPTSIGLQVEEIPDYVHSALQAMGLGDQRVHLVLSPTEVDQLTVLEAGTHLLGNCSAWYREELQIARPWPSGQPEGSALYLSRAGLDRGRPLGETYLEELLEEAGVRVLRPEITSVAQVLSDVEGVRHLIVMDGGASYQCELLARLPDRVTLIARRVEDSGRAEIESSLARKSGHFEVIDANDGYVSIRELADAPWDPQAMALLNLPSLLRRLQASVVTVSPERVDNRAWENSVRADLAAHETSGYALGLSDRADHAERIAAVRAAVEQWIASWPTNATAHTSGSERA